jgi:hypothetical protein
MDRLPRPVLTGLEGLPLQTSSVSRYILLVSEQLLRSLWYGALCEFAQIESNDHADRFPRTIRPTLRQLQYIVAVADMGKFRDAAELLSVSQPSLSEQISDAKA